MLRSISTSAITITACVAAVILFSEPVQAQVQTLSSNSGQTGGNTGTSIGTARTGNQSLGNSQLGGLSTLGDFQQLNTQNSFIGRSDAAVNSFIGRNEAQIGGNNAGQNRNFNRANGAQSGQNQFNNTGQSAPIVPQFRPQMKIAFQSKPLPLKTVSTSMGQSLERIQSRNERLRGVQFELNANRTVTLRGQVKSASAKKLAEFLAKLEPGVSKVKNELTIANK